MVVHGHSHLRIVVRVIVVLLAFALAHLSACLLGDHDFFHLLDGHGTFHVNPLVRNNVLLLEPEDKVDAADVFVGHEAEAAWLVRAFVLQNDRVFNLSKVGEVVLEGG